ncbi:MAG: GDP-mannose 4,6-dehydratase [Candidatus Omnitrophica bacterium]|nr:GDP-mannose 4,6-dehydratase [Candidatus Omnitrophota bacterium]MBU2044793.1 GDP-mannose 4,6-dehydratase [Candidatus Omnitrophota bacterium]MBU2250646.1 GDP-mannose 4,6-dehydratase [Candidatus Omnitrophota bacterium]
MNKKFWNKKSVLITGYEGFLGSHLTKNLIASGAKISGLDILTERKKTILSTNDLARIKIIKGDVGNFGLVKRIIKENKISVIFHLAASSLVSDCLDNPLKGFDTNIKGTWNILEACRKAKGVEAAIIASSDKAYGCHKKLPYRETAPLSGIHPYDVSKSCADLIAYTYYHTYGLPVTVTRCGNIFGPGDFNFSRLIPELMRSIVKNKTLLIRSDGKFTRDYIYVSDIVEGYLVLAEKMKKQKLFGQAFNYSDENPFSVLELVKLVYKISRQKPDYKVLDQAKYEIKHQYLSSNKARKILGWKPKVGLRDGLKKTFNWYKDYLNR